MNFGLRSLRDWIDREIDGAIIPILFIAFVGLCFGITSAVVMGFVINYTVIPGFFIIGALLVLQTAKDNRGGGSDIEEIFIVLLLIFLTSSTIGYVSPCIIKILGS